MSTIPPSSPSSSRLLSSPVSPLWSPSTNQGSEERAGVIEKIENLVSVCFEAIEGLDFKYRTPEGKSIFFDNEHLGLFDGIRELKAIKDKARDPQLVDKVNFSLRRVISECARRVQSDVIAQCESRVKYVESLYHVPELGQLTCSPSKLVSEDGVDKENDSYAVALVAAQINLKMRSGESGVLALDYLAHKLGVLSSPVRKPTDSELETLQFMINFHKKAVLNVKEKFRAMKRRAVELSPPEKFVSEPLSVGATSVESPSPAIEKGNRRVINFRTVSSSEVSSNGSSASPHLPMSPPITRSLRRTFSLVSSPERSENGESSVERLSPAPIGAMVRRVIDFASDPSLSPELSSSGSRTIQPLRMRPSPARALFPAFDLVSSSERSENEPCENPPELFALLQFEEDDLQVISYLTQPAMAATPNVAVATVAVLDEANSLVVNDEMYDLEEENVEAPAPDWGAYFARLERADEASAREVPSSIVIDSAVDDEREVELDDGFEVPEFY